MAGVISFSDKELWYINGWGWRTLMEQAISDAVTETDKHELCTSMHNHGFHAELYDSTTAKRLAELLRGAAVSVRDQFAASADEYERSYVARLDDLIGMLDGQVR